MLVLLDVMLDARLFFRGARATPIDFFYKRENIFRDPPKVRDAHHHCHHRNGMRVFHFSIVQQQLVFSSRPGGFARARGETTVYVFARERVQRFVDVFNGGRR